jgi:hypothetical protein
MKNLMDSKKLIRLSKFLFLSIVLEYLNIQLIIAAFPSQEENITNHYKIFSLAITIGLFYSGVSYVFAYKLDLNKCIFMGIIGRILILGSILYSYFFIYQNQMVAFSLQSIVSLSICLILLNLIMKKLIRNFKEESRIRNEILKIGTTETKIRLAPISQKLFIDKSTIVRTVKEMIVQQEIYAEYFRISNKIAFNIKANNAEIDKLMKLYNEWEELHLGNTMKKV